MPFVFGKKKIPVLLFIVGVVVLLLGMAAYFLLIKPTLNQDAVKLSSQQKQLVEDFGYPTTFILTIGEMTVEGEYKQVRFEAWNYDQLGRRFYFVDGEFQKDIDIDFIENGQYPNLRPSQFSQNTTWDKTQEIIGTSPQAQADIQPEIMEKTSVYDFWGQVKVATEDDKLVYIQTYPVIIKQTDE